MVLTNVLKEQFGVLKKAIRPDGCHPAAFEA
jgi:hypothetical protein